MCVDFIRNRSFVRVDEFVLNFHPGHINHSIFWKNLAPVREGSGEPPKGSLGWAIDTNFGSLEALVKKMNAEGAALQGSVWVVDLNSFSLLWLGVDKELKRLVVETTANQDYLHFPTSLVSQHSAVFTIRRRLQL
ncbi:Superoxide dismutase [Mn], mitochondrial [Capsicum annuum]|nr:Superoxide dismutase [Mn], mitochondrial [Capsicum annuum]KAF3674523.1 Superoxide dismutase [Mn], mitochondrial [Capsicum annuum]